MALVCPSPPVILIPPQALFVAAHIGARAGEVILVATAGAGHREDDATTAPAKATTNLVDAAGTVRSDSRHGRKPDAAASEVATGHRRLNTFTGYIVTVTKHLGPRNTVGTSVIASQTMQLSEILDLQVSLPMRSPPAGGPGFYMFNVTDAGGTGDDAWMVKLGPDLPQEDYQMPGFPSQPGSPDRRRPARRRSISATGSTTTRRSVC